MNEENYFDISMFHDFSKPCTSTIEAYFLVTDEMMFHYKKHNRFYFEGLYYKIIGELINSCEPQKLILFEIE